MTKRDKLRRRLRNNPKGAKFSEIETLLTGFRFKLLRITGSHHVFRYSDGESIEKIVIPVHGNNVKSVYVRDAIEILDDLFPESEIEEEDTGDEGNDEPDN